MGLTTALDHAIHGKPCIDLNRLVPFRLTEDIRPVQGSTTMSKVVGKTGGYRAGGKDVIMDVPSWAINRELSDELVFIMPYDPLSRGSQLLFGQTSLELIAEKTKNARLTQMIFQLNEQAGKVQHIDELREEIRLKAENASRLTERETNFPHIQPRYSTSEAEKMALMRGLG